MGRTNSSPTTRRQQGRALMKLGWKAAPSATTGCRTNGVDEGIGIKELRAARAQVRPSRRCGPAAPGPHLVDTADGALGARLRTRESDTDAYRRSRRGAALT
jgi:hypothetical protein